MNFLKKWFTPINTEQSLSIPDFKNAPILKITMRDTIITFKNPRMSAVIPTTPPITDIDTSQASSFSDPVHDYEKNCYLKFYGSGWDYKNDSKSFGGTTLSIMVSKLLVEADNNNLLNLNNLTKWILSKEKTSYEQSNQEKLTGRDPIDLPRIKEQYFFRYPDTTNDIEKISFNNVTWLRYQTYQPGYPPTIRLVTSVSHSNAIILIFNPSSYQDDYYSPTQNTPELVEKTISDFIGSFHIKLSEEAKDQLRNTPQPTVINIED